MFYTLLAYLTSFNLKQATEADPWTRRCSVGAKYKAPVAARAPLFIAAMHRDLATVRSWNSTIKHEGENYLHRTFTISAP